MFLFRCFFSFFLVVFVSLNFELNFLSFIQFIFFFFYEDVYVVEFFVVFVFEVFQEEFYFYRVFLGQEFEFVNWNVYEWFWIVLVLVFVNDEVQVKVFENYYEFCDVFFVFFFCVVNFYCDFVLFWYQFEEEYWGFYV